jgi:hypothetical protein
VNGQHITQQPDPLTTARMLALGRGAIGVVALLVPKTVGRVFLGSIVDAPGGTAAVRTIGGRDLALGAGALIADLRGRPLRGWVEVGVLVDLLDCFVALFLGRGVPLLSRLSILIIGGGAAAAGILAANGLSEASERAAHYAVDVD